MCYFWHIVLNAFLKYILTEADEGPLIPTEWKNARRCRSEHSSLDGKRRKQLRIIILFSF